jgi:hypothetical protein
MTGRHIERYEDNGDPIYEEEGDPLKEMWKFMSAYNQDKYGAPRKKNETEIETKDRAFDYTEFSKRLYLARAELDITSSVLHLLTSVDETNPINLSILQHHDNNATASNSSADSEKRVFALKASFIANISKDLRSNAETLQFNRACEHKNICGILFSLRENYSCSLVRISTPEHIQVSLDYKELVPIIGINYCPSVLFKNSSDSSEQYNYRPPHLVSGEHLALVLQTPKGALKLLFQPKSEHIFRSILVELTDGLSNISYKCRFFNATVSSFSRELIDLDDNDITLCSEVIKLARNRTLFFNLVRQLATEAANFPQDVINVEDYLTSILIDSRFKLCISFVSESSMTSESENDSLENWCKTLLENYLSSSGNGIRWPEIREQIIHFYSN